VARILLIEPDRILANNVTRTLEAAGHQVELQVDPQVAVESADKLPPQLIIMEMLLADRSGAEFLYELRSYPEWQALPVVVFSSIALADLGASAASLQQLNIAAYHYKPSTSLDQLLKTVGQALQVPTALASG